MNDAHVYEMQVQMWKPNTWGVTRTLSYVGPQLAGHRHDIPSPFGVGDVESPVAG